MEKKAKRKEQFELHVLRCVAALYVMFIHLSFNIGITPQFSFFSDYGLNGVAIFYVISGYLSFLTYSGRSVGDYYKKRFVRILLPYWACVLLFFGIGFLIFGREGFVWWRFLLFFSGANMLVPSDDFYLWNSPCNLWTMTVFIVFYLILPLLAKWIKNGKRSVVFFLLCFAVKLLQEKYFAGFLYRFFPTMDGIDAFAWDFFPVISSILRWGSSCILR